MHLSLSVLIKAILMKLNDMPMILFGHMVKKKLLLTKKIWDYVNIYFLLDYYDAVIVLEDDIIVAPGFYKFAVAATKFYCNDNNIAGISLYNYPFNYQTFEPFDALKSEYDVYFMQIAMSWGQVWMRDSWRRFYNW